jgi:hypothetical protein
LTEATTLRVSSIDPPATVPSQQSLDNEKGVSITRSDFYAQQCCSHLSCEPCAKRRRTTSYNAQSMDQEQFSTAIFPTQTPPALTSMTSPTFITATSLPHHNTLLVNEVSSYQIILTTQSPTSTVHGETSDEDRDGCPVKNVSIELNTQVSCLILACHVLHRANTHRSVSQLHSTAAYCHIYQKFQKSRLVKAIIMHRVALRTRVSITLLPSPAALLEPKFPTA